MSCDETPILTPDGIIKEEKIELLFSTEKCVAIFMLIFNSIWIPPLFCWFIFMFVEFPLIVSALGGIPILIFILVFVIFIVKACRTHIKTELTVNNINNSLILKKTKLFCNSSKT